MHGIDERRAFKPLRIAVLTVSDSRSFENDGSGDTLCARLRLAGHTLAARSILPDEPEQLTQQLQSWIADPTIDVVLSTGGTGVTGRDITPEVVQALADKHIPGFGELFRQLSYASIGVSCIQSRALAVLAGHTYIFALPGSTGACRDAWDQILVLQLDNRHRPCNFAELIPRLRE